LKAEGFLKNYVREMREAYEINPNGKLSCDTVSPEILEVA
jgi:hypothetical protein